jgi:hypothetical protein
LPKLIKRLARSHKLVRTAAFGAFTGLCFVAGIFLATHIKVEPRAPMAAAELAAASAEPPPVAEPAPVPVPAPRIAVVAPQAEPEPAAESTKKHKKTAAKHYVPTASMAVAASKASPAVTPAPNRPIAMAAPARPIAAPIRRIDDGF